MLPRVKCEEVVVSTNLHDGDDHRSVHAHHVDGSDGDDSAVDGDEDDDDDRDDRGDDGDGDADACEKCAQVLTEPKLVNWRHRSAIRSGDHRWGIDNQLRLGSSGP